MYSVETDSPLDLLSKNQFYHDVPEDLMPIILGNPNAQTKIIRVTHPLGVPCASAHYILDHLLKEREDIKLEILFSTSVDKADIRTDVARHLIALNNLSNKKNTEVSLVDWYNRNDIKYLLS